MNVWPIGSEEFIGTGVKISANRIPGNTENYRSEAFTIHYILRGLTGQSYAPAPLDVGSSFAMV